MSRMMLLTLAALLVAAPAAAAKDPREFNSPTGNIRCGQFGTQLRCDMLELGNPRPPRPASCEFDYGNSFGIGRLGRRGRRLCVSDAVAGPGSPTLAYGRTWRGNGFRCRMRTTGIRCTNPLGHGFALRRGRQRLF